MHEEFLGIPNPFNWIKDKWNELKLKILIFIIVVIALAITFKIIQWKITRGGFRRRLNYAPANNYGSNYGSNYGWSY